MQGENGFFAAGLESFKTSDGCEIAYQVVPGAKAKAPRVALIHSLAMDHSFWDRVIAALAGEMTVLVYDCRGHGRSGRPAGPFTLEQMARDLAELFDHAGWESALVAGCSMGGCIAQAFAALYPHYTQGLALIDTTAWYGPDAPAKWRERAAATRASGLGARVDFQITRWFSDAFRASHPEEVSAMTRVFVANDLDCYAASCVMLGTADLRPYLSRLRMPVAIVVGEEDYATPVEMARELHRAVQNSKLTIVKGARHAVPVESPDAIAAQLLELARRVEAHRLRSPCFQVAAKP